MKLKELLTEFYTKEINKEKLEAEREKFRALSMSEKKIEYKSFGRLGKNTSPEQVMMHRADGSKKHDWGFSAQYPGYSQEQCYICARSRYVYSNGAIRQR